MNENNEESTQTEEELIPLVGEEEGKETKPEEGEEEKETPSESSTEEKPEEETVSDEDETSVKNEETVESKKEPWDADGLARAKEKLLEDIEELRKEKRQLKGEPQERIFVDKKNDDLSDVAPADVELVEKVLKARGYVKKDELQNLSYQERLSAEQNAWLEKNPEYLPKNDPHNIRWDELKETFDRYYKLPSNPREIGKILDLIKSQTTHVALPRKNSASVAASKEKLKVISKTAGGGGGVKSVIKKNSGIDRSVFKDFSDDELEEMGV